MLAASLLAALQLPYMDLTFRPTGLDPSTLLWPTACLASPQLLTEAGWPPPNTDLDKLLAPFDPMPTADTHTQDEAVAYFDQRIFSQGCGEATDEKIDREREELSQVAWDVMVKLGEIRGVELECQVVDLLR